MAHIVAVSLSPVHGFSKRPQPRLHLLAGEGAEGDAHRGVTVQHLYQKRRDPTAPNLAQVHLFATEMLAELGAKGFELAAGDLGENILTEGLDLLNLPEGACLSLGLEAVLEITGLRTPCTKIDSLRPGLQQHLWSERGPDGKRARRAGVMALVRQSGWIAPGEAISVSLPPEPLRPLRPV